MMQTVLLTHISVINCSNFLRKPKIKAIIESDHDLIDHKLSTMVKQSSWVICSTDDEHCCSHAVGT